MAGGESGRGFLGRPEGGPDCFFNHARGGRSIAIRPPALPVVKAEFLVAIEVRGKNSAPISSPAGTNDGPFFACLEKHPVIGRFGATPALEAIVENGLKPGREDLAGADESVGDMFAATARMAGRPMPARAAFRARAGMVPKVDDENVVLSG